MSAPTKAKADKPVNRLLIFFAPEGACTNAFSIVDTAFRSGMLMPS
jgi:hypothetical protein